MDRLHVLKGRSSPSSVNCFLFPKDSGFLQDCPTRTEKHEHTSRKQQKHQTNQHVNGEGDRQRGPPTHPHTRTHTHTHPRTHTHTQIPLDAHRLAFSSLRRSTSSFSSSSRGSSQTACTNLRSTENYAVCISTDQYAEAGLFRRELLASVDL